MASSAKSSGTGSGSKASGKGAGSKAAGSKAAGSTGVIDSRYYRDNLAAWDERAPAHARAAGYKVSRFHEDPAYLSDVVTFDIPLLGDVSGLGGVHLQCHIGTDTMSLARLGAEMTGLDFSAVSIAEARSLSARCGTRAEFVVGDVHRAVEILGQGRFDLVFTGVGALCWLPDIRRWAGVVEGLLAPGGRLFLREGHPMLWALADPDGSGLLTVEHPYFETELPTVWDDPGTYVSTDVQFATTRSYEWNHGLGEVVGALLERGLVITGLEEHDSVPWDALPGLMERAGGGEFRLADRPERLPCSYTLQARKPG